MKLSTCFLFALQNVTRRKWILFLFWFEIIAMLFSFLMVKGIVNHYEGERQLVRSFQADQCLLLSTNDNSPHIEGEVRRLMQTDSNITDVGSVLHLSPFSNEEDASFNFSAYDDLFVQTGSLPLSRGKQLRDCTPENGAVPVIVGTRAAETFHYGETYTIHYAGEMKIQVVGVLDKNNAYYNFSGGGSVIYLPGLLGQDPDIILCATSALADQPIAKAIDLDSRSSHTILVKVKETEGAAYEKTVAALSEFGYPNKAADVKKVSMEQLFAQLLPYLLQMIIVLLACLVGIYGYNLYKQYDNQRKNSICYLCGGTNWNFVAIQGMEAFITLLIPTLIGLYWGCRNSIQQASLGSSKFLITDPFWALLLILFLYCVSYLPYTLRQMKTQPIDMIRRFE